jgi:hypothetical protein
MMREDVHLRLSKDEDYKEKRGDGRSPYEFLDKLLIMHFLNLIQYNYISILSGYFNYLFLSTLH